MPLTTANLQVQQVKISELKPSEYNPRKWSEDQLQKLRESLDRFGVVDRSSTGSVDKYKNISINTLRKIG